MKYTLRFRIDYEAVVRSGGGGGGGGGSREDKQGGSRIKYKIHIQNEVKNEVKKWSMKMKYENEVQRFYRLFIPEYSFFMNEVFWVKFEVLLGQ